MRELKGLPRSRVYRLVRKGEVRVNLGRVNAAYRLQSGDRVRIPPVRLGAGTTPQVPESLDTGAVLFEDAHLLVLDKPAGVPVHGGTGISAGVIEALRARRPDLPFLELVHRLDRDTSGCLMLAKSRAALTAMHAALRRETSEPAIVKHYTALVRGRPSRRRIDVRTGLDRSTVRGGERTVTVADAGDPAESVFRLRRPGTVCSEVEIELVTGRTHQARVHAAHIGHPIAGDRKYGEQDFNKRARGAGLKRLALHAHTLAFTHPVTGESCRVEAPVPETFTTVFKDLNQ
jgi:23S rRNA pseudouridine955/2504/2580 synthase